MEDDGERRDIWRTFEVGKKDISERDAGPRSFGDFSSCVEGERIVRLFIRLKKAVLDLRAVGFGVRVRRRAVLRGWIPFFIF